ncbi:MAG: YjjG family noncanonical pyrimidine nucleotidase [Chloroflexota bacterium]|jgi:YjjG family noncanonical pyrimidine nucleotidase
MTYSVILFDADGTLFDYDRAETWALTETFAQYGLRFEPAYSQVYRQVNDPLWDAFEQGTMTQDRLKVLRFELLFENLGFVVDAGSFSDAYSRQLGKATFLVDGASDLIAALSGRHRLLLLTNGLTDVQRPRFTASTIGRYFEDWVISEEVGVAKPDPRIFDIAFARLGQPARQEVLIVGDSLTSDMAGGFAYGIDTCWYNPTGRQADASLPVTYEIQNLAQLVDILNSD